jgi:hypothetical protein
LLLTLAFLDDTGHYRVVNATGGRFISEEVSTYGECSTSGSTSFADFVFGNDRKWFPVCVAASAVVIEAAVWCHRLTRLDADVCRARRRL